MEELGLGSPEPPLITREGDVIRQERVVPGVGRVDGSVDSLRSSVTRTRALLGALAFESVGHLPARTARSTRESVAMPSLGRSASGSFAAAEQEM
jgi:hypothetical protein